MRHESLRTGIRSAASVILAAALIALSAGAANAAEGRVLPRTISVGGEGEISSKPDQARLTAGVVTQAPTAAAALTANTTAMNRVFAALKAIGVPDNKIQTSNFSVQPQYPPFRPDAPEPRTIVGYQVSNQVNVIVDDLGKLGPVLDALVKSGANQLGGVAFSIANPKPLAERARAAAVADAMAKAKTLAMAAGVNLGPLLSIEEGTALRPVPRFAEARAALAPAPPPIAIGEESVTVNVTLTYAIQ
ncbi:MAG TPA: SIMPL domain-containing protein [Micropepsaceae bacterium]|nr:SIMPL domain-containing protein [Micropepsaceae bacterium]